VNDERPPHDPEKGEECECFQCHIGSVNLGFPRDLATRTYSETPPRGTTMNSFENGIPTSKRPGGTEMPYLRSDGEVMRVKEFREKSHQIKENRKRAQVGLPPT
jgi:hypothetical protein